MFRDNQLHRAVYLEAKFRSLYQGDTSMLEYTSRLKQLADALRDIGQPVSEQSQVLNLLCVLNPKYRYTIPVINDRRPPHTFLSARSYLLLEELYDKEHVKMVTHLAMVATQGSSHLSAPSAAASITGSGSANRDCSYTKKKRGRGGQPSGTSASNTGGSPFGAPSPGDAQLGASSGCTPFPNNSRVAGYNPWTGLVQAWPMPFRPPASGVLSPRPGTQAPQAYYATQPSFTEGPSQLHGIPPP